MSSAKASSIDITSPQAHEESRSSESPFTDDHRANLSQSAENEQHLHSRASGEEDTERRDDLETESDSDSDYAVPPKKEHSRRPNDNAFQQQRLKAVNPVITAKWLISIFLGMGVFLIPLGGAMWLAAHRVQDLKIDYSQCENLASLDHWSPIPEKYTTYNYHGNKQVQQAQWRLDTDESQPFEDERRVCRIQFHVPHDLKSPLYFFYRLEKFSQNHRRYAKSFSEDQIEGKAASLNSIKGSVGENCEPLSQNDEGKKYYPCGLIANSLFNDTYSSTLRGVNGTSEDYVMSRKNIAWSTNKNRFKKTKYSHTEIAPPPNWYKRFPNGYNETNVPDISTWEDFQNWMFTSALQNFNKLYMKNVNESLKEGIYEVSVGLHFPVLPYEGKKMIFISQRSAIGGKNFFLGFSWIAGGAVCLIMGILILVLNTIKPRKPGDEQLLSWVRESMKEDSKDTPNENSVSGSSGGTKGNSD
ncbi:alkylphosphocholine resistance protein lem3 [Candidozyma auris]|uniref:Cell cycle control protein n=2 Tax=Candidozyma auris TaxID=498019 RepID=A0AB36W7E4_CANAR|nr:hypothetical protein QG37_06126 [[Candida] auris]PIS54706.1 hypothetical protein B9J08_002485 [[Candida] auris]PIS55330.1 hypothetical protein CJI97_002028 [[Candida] auris]QWW25768.1 hypothetical protein CA7LBN_004672 [[Candida] auris]